MLWANLTETIQKSMQMPAVTIRQYVPELAEAGQNSCSSKRFIPDLFLE
jgi:hypothetical protein